MVIAPGTATVGSIVAARTLGEGIIARYLSSNTAFVLQGGLIVGLFAVLICDALVSDVHSYGCSIGPSGKH